MQALYTLTIPGTPATTLTFGILDKESEYAAVYAQRYRVYKKYDYIDAGAFPQKSERDEYDQDHCVYFGAYNGTRLLGSVRMILKEKSVILPIEKFFSFKSEKRSCEISRLVIERQAGIDDIIPRNLVLLLLGNILVEEAARRSLTQGYAYLTDSLANKLSLLRVPYVRIAHTGCRYPRDGVMSKYFYSTNAEIIPAAFSIEEMINYFHTRIHSRALFVRNGNHLILRQTVYTSLLQRLRIL